MAQPESTGLRLLVLDGGDIRCLSQLSILEEFLHQVQWKRKSDELLLPCDYFHMICATGPAGMIVIFFVVFRMSIQEAKDEFVRIWMAVFVDDYCKPEERSTQLERMIKNLLRKRNMSSSRKLLHGSGDEACKAFLCAISPEAPTACQKLRTYRSPQRHTDVSIIEAIRATSATPNRFTSVKFRPPRRDVDPAVTPGSNHTNHDTQEFIAGDNVLQNPTREAIKELHEIYGAERRVACVLSLGCGRPSAMHMDVLRNNWSTGSWMTGMLQVERITEELEAQMGKNQVYYRFSVDRGLESPESIPLNNLGVIETHTRAYLQQTNASRDMQNCVRASEVCGNVSTADLYCPPTRAIAATHGLPPLCASFVMRQKAMDSMAHCMFGSDKSSQKIMILSGMGGSGKTQLISKFALLYLDRFQHILFIDARTADSIKNGIISRVRSLGGICSTLDDALEFLTRIGPGSLGPWFLILDNADNPSLELGPYIPNYSHGFIAITTRNPTVGDLNPQGHIKLDVMSEEEALQALLRTIYNSTEQASNDDCIDGRVVVKELGFLPVAIVQAGSYIKHQGRGCTRDYLKKLRAHRQKLLAIPAKSQRDRHYHAVYATLDVTLDVLSTPAKDMLGILACFNYTGFPLPLFDRAAGRGFVYQPFKLFDRPPEFQETAQFLQDLLNPMELRDLDTLAELEQFSLVVRVENYSMTTLRFHPLTHAWMVDRIAAQDANKFWSAAVRVLICGTSEEDEDLFEYLLPQMAFLSPNLDNAHWNDRAASARVHLCAGDRSVAIKTWRNIHRKVTQVYGVTDIRSTVVKLQFALTYDAEASWSTQKDAINMIEEVISLRSQALSLYHPDTLEAISTLSEVKTMRPTRISDQDISRQLDVVNRLQQYTTPELCLPTLKSKETLAKMYKSREQWAEAEKLLLDLIQAREELQGPFHWMTLGSKQLLAQVYSLQHPGSSTVSRSVNSAEKLQEELIIYRTKSQGPYHVDTLKAQQFLGELYEQAGRHNLALAVRRQVVEGYKAARGPHSSYLLHAMEQLVNLLEKSNQWKEVVVWRREIVEASKTIDNKQQVYDAMNSLAMLLETMGQLDDAINCREQLVGQCKAADNDLETYSAMKSLAELLERSDRQGDAVDQWEQIVVERKAMDDNQEALQAMESLAKLLERLGRYSDAVSWWIKIIAAWKTMDNAQEARRSTEALVNLLEKLGQHDDAVPWCEQIIAAWNALGNNAEVLQSTELLVSLLEKSRRPDEAVARWGLLIEGWKVKGNDWMCSQAMGSLVKLLQRSNRREDALVVKKRQLVEEWKARENNREARKNMVSLVHLLEKLGRREDAVDQWEQLIEECKRTGDNKNAIQAMESLAKLFERVGRHQDMVAQWEQLIEECKRTGNNRDAIQAMELLSKLFEKLGRCQDAVAQWEQLIEECKRTGDNKNAIQAMESLAKLFERVGRHNDVVSWREQVIKALKEIGNRQKTLQAMKSLVEQLEKMERYDDVVLWQEQVIKMLKEIGDRQKALQAMKSLAELLQKMGRFDDAVARWEQVIEDWNAQGDKEEVLQYMESLAKLLEKMGRLEDAVTRWKQVIAEWKTKGDSWKASNGMESLAKLLEKMGRFGDAMAQWEQAIAVWKVEGGSWQAVQAIRSLEKLLVRLGRLEDAVALWEQAIAEWKTKGNNWQAIDGMDSLAKLLEKMERSEDAMTWRKKIEDEGEQYPFWMLMPYIPAEQFINK